MNPYLKNLLVLLAVIITITVVFCNKITNNGDVMQISDKNVIRLDTQVSNYLVNESKYKKIFSSTDKNIIFYGEESSCPYSQKFVQKMEAIKHSGIYRNNYNFVKMSNNISVITMKDKDFEKLNDMKKNNPEGYNQLINNGMQDIDNVLPDSKGKLLNNFYKNCGVFCIINASRDHMLRFNGVGNKEIKQLDFIVEKYSNNNW